MLTVGTFVSQWPETTRSAFGCSGSVDARLSSQARIRSHVLAGPIVHSMKKQGPPPCGMKSVGMREGFEIMSPACARPRRSTSAHVRTTPLPARERWPGSGRSRGRVAREPRVWVSGGPGPPPRGASTDHATERRRPRPWIEATPSVCAPARRAHPRQLKRAMHRDNQTLQSEPGGTINSTFAIEGGAISRPFGRENCEKQASTCTTQASRQALTVEKAVEKND